MSNFKIATFNTVSLVVRKRKQWLLNLMLREKLDIVCLQETKLASQEQVDVAREFFGRLYDVFTSNAVGRSGGTAVLVRKNAKFTTFSEWERDMDGRVCSVELLHRREMYKVVSIHAPNVQSERKSFFINLRQYLDTPVKTILAGDFNCVLESADCTGTLRADASRTELRKFLRDFDLQDVTELVSGPNPCYTHWQGTCHARLDRVYVSSDCATDLVSSTVTPIAFSDHGLVTVRFGSVPKKKARDLPALENE